MIAAENQHCVGVSGRRREFKQVERAIHSIQSEQMRAVRPGYMESHAVKTKRDVRIGDALQRATAQFPEKRRRARRGEGTDGFLARDVRPQAADATGLHAVFVRSYRK